MSRRPVSSLSRSDGEGDREAVEGLSPPPRSVPLSPGMPSTVARTLKVNHGGEHGTSRIYAAQIAAARWRCPDLVPELADLLAHERPHEQMILALMIFPRKSGRG